VFGEEIAALHKNQGWTVRIAFCRLLLSHFWNWETSLTIISILSVTIRDTL